MASYYTDNDIRQQVRICLMKIARDDAFVESQLHANDFDGINSEAMDSKEYDLFLNYVAMAMTNKIQRKADKFIKQRLTHNSIVQKEIDKFDPDTYVLEEPLKPPVVGAASSKAPPKPEMAMDVDLEAPAKEKVAKKKRARSKSVTKKEAKSRKKGRVHLEFSDTEKQKLAQDAEKEHLSEKADLMERIPEEYARHIGKIVFGKWRKDPYRPVLLAGPYQVPPGHLRDTWMKMFENVEGDLKRMWYWCFWYGSPLGEAYTQQRLKDFTLYEDAVKRKLNTLDSKIVKKLENGKKLTKTDEQIIEGFEMLDEKLNTPADERRGQDFREDHEGILNLDDNVSLPDDEAMDDGTDDDTGTIESEERPKKPATKKKTPAKKKGEPVADDFINDDLGEQELSNDESHHDDSDDAKDGDFDKDSVEDDDEKDTDFKEVGKPVKKKKKNASAVKEEVPNLQKKERTPQEEEKLAKRRKSENLRKMKKKEAQKYEDCLKRFQPIVDSLRDASEKKDVVTVVSCMKQLLDKVGFFSPPFIERSNLPSLTKATKELLTSDEDQLLRKDLYQTLKALYNEKKSSVPKGWKVYLEIDNTKPKDEKVKSKVTKKKKSDVEAGAASENGDESGAKMEKERSSEKVPSLHSSRHGVNRQNLDAQGKAAEMLPKREREESSGSNPESSQVRIESSSSPVPPKKVDAKREGSSGSQVSNKHRAESSHPSMKAPKRKTSLTSLKSLLNKEVKTPKAKSEVSGARKSLEPAVSAKKLLPEWLTAGIAMDSEVESNECRSLGYEFFLEVSETFPSSVNRTGIARALEGAAHKWATERKTSQRSWEGGYWEKLHTVVGSLGGKHRAGSLLAAIVDGKYPSAQSIIDLSDDVLMQSFDAGQNGCY